MNLPLDITELRHRWQNGERFEFYPFYGHKPPVSGVDASCLSQWFVRDFSVDGHQYATAEHWMMAEKARLFLDNEMLTAILNSESPRDAKALGRKVKGFDAATWNEHKFEIVVRGNRAKFSQNSQLMQFLLATAEVETEFKMVAEAPQVYKIGDGSNSNTRSASNAILVEAAARDAIWGIGLGQNNPKSRDPMQWRGENLLGFALTKIREQLLND